MACDPTTNLDDEGARAAGDRQVPAVPHVSAHADGEPGMDSLAAGASQQAIPSADEIERIVQSRHDMPYRVARSAAAPEAASGRWCARSCRTPDASSCACSENGRPSTKCIGGGIGKGCTRRGLPRPTDTIDYEYLVQEEGRAPYRCSDPYRFRRVRFTAEDERLFVRGEHLRLFEKLDARPTTRGDVPGVEFAVWAPAAQRVSVVGTFDAWEAAGIRCNGWRRAASGSCSSPASAWATSTNTRSRPPTAPFS